MGLYTIKKLTIILLTIISIVLYIGIGLALRRYAAALYNKRPFRETLVSRMFKKTRAFRLNHFHYLAHSVIQDLLKLLAKASTYHEARAMAPIIVEIRKEGENLLAKRGFFHSYWATTVEHELESVLNTLRGLEETVKSLPRSPLSIEDVLAGNFEKHNFS